MEEVNITEALEAANVTDALEDGNATWANDSVVDYGDLSRSVRYAVVVPLLMAACLVTFLMNAVIIAAFPLIRNLSRVRSPFCMSLRLVTKTHCSDRVALSGQ